MFRSRIEARWAVFLYELKVDYNYEPPRGDAFEVFVEAFLNTHDSF